VLVVLAWAVGPVEALASAESAQTLRIEVAHIEGTDLNSIQVHGRWLGQARGAALFDDGIPPDAVAEDGTWTTEWSGDPIRMLPLRLVASCTSEAGLVSREVYAGTELLTAGDNLLSFAINKDCSAPAIRLPSGQNEPLAPNYTRLAGHAIWLVIGLLLVSLGVVLHRPVETPRDTRPVWPWIFFWLLLAGVWTWPAALAGPEIWVGRHFDLPGTIWSISAIPRIGWQLSDSLTGWPTEADYSRFDSYMLIPITHLFQFLHPAKLHGWLQIGGVAVSAWAAQGFARALGARSPWDLVAGLTYGFSGVASTALLEGHVYVTIALWMPLFGWAWWLAMTRQRTVKQGLIAGTFFCLSALTTAYLGLAAAVLAVGFFVGGLIMHGTRVLRPALAACIPVAPLVAALFWVTSTGDPGVHDTTMASIQMGSANLLNVLGPFAQIDFNGHSIAPVISPIALALMCVAPLVVPGWRRLRMIWWTGVVALLLSFGMSIDADANSPLLPLPLFWVLEAFESRWYRFPVRMFWGWSLCAGVLSAVALTSLSGRKQWLSWLILLGALGHSFLAVRHFDRQRTHMGQTPSAYTAVEGPVLDLFPEGSDLAREEELWFSALACAYQVEHRQPLAENCVSTVPQDNPRNVLGRVVRAQLLAGRIEFVQETLASIGFSAIALHIDLFSPGDADRIRSALETLGAPIAETTDGGEHILLLPVPASIETQGLLQSQRVAILEAANDSHFTTHSTIGAVLADLETDLPLDRVVRIEVREEMSEAPEVDNWIATVAWGDQEKTLAFIDPQEAMRGEDELEFWWVATWSGAIPAQFNLKLTGVNRVGDATAEWKGEVYSRTATDRVVFAYGADGLRPIVPTARLEAALHETDAGLIAATFWGFFVFLAIWMQIAMRWSIRRRSAVTREA
jgi:hypothetical protein